MSGIRLSRSDSERRKSMDPKRTGDSVDKYAVQCGLCFKWTVIPSKEEYETIRHSFIEDPWFCDKMPGRSCESPADIEYDASRLWVIDKPSLPKPPAGFERILVRRNGLSKFDAYYVTPTGKRVRSGPDLERFIKAHPKYKDVSASDFCFTSPKILNDMTLSTEDLKRQRA